MCVCVCAMIYGIIFSLFHFILLHNCIVVAQILDEASICERLSKTNIYVENCSWTYSPPPFSPPRIHCSIANKRIVLVSFIYERDNLSLKQYWTIEYMYCNTDWITSLREKKRTQNKRNMCMINWTQIAAHIHDDNEVERIYVWRQ